MIFKNLHLSGFGIFHGASLADLSEGLNIIEGPNEAGKTSTVEFIRGLLFGFPGSRANPPYPPQRGGEHGGRAHLVDRGGREIEIERSGGGSTGKFAARALNGGGDVGFNQLVVGADTTLYNNVFAVTLAELQNLDKLTEENIGNRIYSAASGAGAVSLEQAVSLVEDRERTVYFTGGRSQEIVNLGNELQHIGTQIASLQDNLTEYNRLQQELTECDSLQADLDNSLRQKTREKLRAQLHRAVWATWNELQRARAEIEVLDAPENLPTNGLVRLERLREDEVRERDGLEKADKIKLRLAGELEEISVDGILLEADVEIARLCEQLGDYEKTRDEAIPDSLNTLEIRDRSFKERVNRLGAGWDEERLLRFDVSIAATGRIEQFRKDIEAAEREISNARHDARKATEAAEAATRAVQQKQEEIAREYPTTPPEPAQIDKVAGVLRRATNLHAEADKVAATEKNINDRLADLRLEQEELEPGPTLPLWPALLGLLLIPLAILVTREPLVWGLIAFIGVLMAAGWFALANWQKNQLQQRAERAQKRREEGGRRKVDLERQLQETQHKGASVQTDLHALEAPSDFDLLDRQSLLTAESQMDSIRRQRAAFEMRQAELEQLKRSAETAKQAVQDAHGRVNEVQDASGSTQEQWAGWLKQNHLPLDIAPLVALELFKVAETARDLLSQRNEQAALLENLQSRVGQFTDVTNVLFDKLRRARPADGELVAAVRRLNEELQRQRDWRHREEQLQRQLRENEESIELLQGQIERTRDSVSILLKEAGVHDEEEFRRCAELGARCRELQQQIAQLQSTLESHTGTGEAREQLERELAAIREHQDIEERLGAAGAEVDELDRRRNECSNRRGELSQSLTAMATEEELTTLLRRRDTLEGELKDAVERWAVLRIARHLLEKTRERFERERQPAIIQRAAEYFHRITGRYELIIAGSGLQNLLIETADGQRRKVHECSRGTAEQLYLALRFAFIEDYCSHAEPLPVVMDDVLVHADGYTRFDNAATAIAELAQKHQVLYFTCHPGDADRLIAAMPKAKRFRVEDGSFATIGN